MSRTIMKHLNHSRLVKSEHTNVISIRKDKLASYQDKGFEVIEEGDDVYLIGKPKPVAKKEKAKKEEV